MTLPVYIVSQKKDVKKGGMKMAVITFVKKNNLRLGSLYGKTKIHHFCVRFKRLSRVYFVEFSERAV